MNDFWASNGISVEVKDEVIVFRSPKYGMYVVDMGREEIDALREFFMTESSIWRASVSSWLQKTPTHRISPEVQQ